MNTSPACITTARTYQTIDYCQHCKLIVAFYTESYVDMEGNCSSDGEFCSNCDESNKEVAHVVYSLKA